MRIDSPEGFVGGEEVRRHRLRRVEDASEESLQADRRLADRCLAGEVAAWEDFYAQCHDPLCTAIRIMLGHALMAILILSTKLPRGYGTPWLTRTVNSWNDTLPSMALGCSRLCGPLRDEICRYFRAEIRRRQREFSALCERSPSDGSDSGQLAQSAMGLKEFLATLTPQEHGFCCEVLLAEPTPGGEVSRSPANVWQLTHRIYKKLVQFLAR